MADDQLPLKGFIGCSKCSRTLCGRASKGVITTTINTTVALNAGVDTKPMI